MDLLMLSYEGQDAETASLKLVYAFGDRVSRETSPFVSRSVQYDPISLFAGLPCTSSIKAP